jgi:DNA-binding response OmpR family regulator
MATKVMLVDDEEMIRESVSVYLKDAGIGILTAASGSECIDCLKAGFRGVILMDVMMPEMTGWDTIRSIAESDLYDGNIIVMLTALNAPDSKMDGLQEYVTDYMTKPFDPKELIDSIAYYQSLLNGETLDDE